ncbi:antibacterial peptide protease. Metallo peptidase. MEROPS family M06 [Bacillus sp. OV166]|uniref:immune inhibitor A domain-containing protein n=1 Tax=Bacillus sp. OV166 TaxID=1882763 RepID=UPI000A2ADF40|nr:immune inhibitor A domain-containing protein [Bacillus sp. OV166]SMQ58857.1 antibacterial peptide protease. Metallo peptidase. MEROPS family M06 [Bacillus sp. OV166]
MVKKNRALKVFSSITASTIVASSLFVGTLGGSALAPQSAAAATKVPTSFDAGIANDEKLIEMLKREGKLAKNASPAESEKALKSYLKGKGESTKTKDTLPKSLANIKESDKGTSNDLKNGKGNKLGQAKKSTVDSVEKESYNGAVRKDKVLVLAIDFSDYEKSSITKEETDMFYEDYTHDHFQDMIFGKNGYTGPDGKNYISMKQYYEQQSGGSYTVEGTVAGWYKADHEAAYYGANSPGPEDSDIRARSLVVEALTKAAKDPSINLADYDVWDRDDYDGDGVYNEPDAIIDHLMVIHAGVGEEAGGGSLGGDAIWSHRSKLSTGPIGVPGGKSNSNRFGGVLAAWDYTIEPEDGAAGVFTHEFGHDLGLPDEYDTQYTGAGEPVEYWSLMSSGSWGGAIPGTEPPGISPYSREMLQALHGGNWLTGTTLNASEITKAGTNVLLDEGVTKGTNDDAVRIDLPDKENSVNTPTSGQFEYYSGSGNEMENSMVTSVDLSSATSAELKFNAWYDIEEDWDYASVQVKEEGSTAWTAIQGTITTAENPNDQNPGNGITGTSDGWVPATFDLTAYAGKKIDLKFNYWTDPFVAQRGIYVDDISITAGASTVLNDDVEGVSKFTLDGFTKDKGKFLSKHYYLLEWRSHNGVDQGLAHIRRGDSLISYDPGLVVWYVDETYDNNWTGMHPGNGFLGVVDADQHTTYWSDKAVAATRYQVHDAAFGLSKTDKMFLDYSNIPGFGVTMKDNFSQRNPLFDDSANYSNAGLVDAGRSVPNYGLKFRVVGESADGTVGKVLIFK